jgi:hypothetical protein
LPENNFNPRKSKTSHSNEFFALILNIPDKLGFG